MSEQTGASNVYFCVHCHAEFPASAEGLAAGMEHEAQCLKHPLALRIAGLEAERGMLRSALVGLVGADGDKALREMELGVSLVPAPDAEKVVMVEAIHALRATLKGEEAAR